MTLTTAQVRAFYDRFGRKQDSQAFYEDAAFDALIDHAKFEQARAVFEIGCGTGRFALRLLQEYLPPDALYHGMDLSTTMVALARERLAPFAERGRVELSDGTLAFPVPDRSVDRVVVAYVLDLLSEEDIRQTLTEARRVLTPDGKLCMISLTRGTTLSSRVVSGTWNAIFRLRASLVGGCRPISLVPFLDRRQWSIASRQVVTPFAIPSEVVIVIPVGTSI